MTDEVADHKSELESLKEKYQETLKNEPNSPVFVMLGEILRKQGEVDRATEILVKGLRNNPRNFTARTILGMIYYDRWMIDQAKKQLEMVISDLPDDLSVSKILIQIYRSEGDLQKAVEISNASFVFHTEDIELRAIISELSEELRLASHTKGHQPNPGDVNNNDAPPNAFNDEVYTETLANIYFHQGIYEKALNVYEKLYEQEPENNTIRERLELSKAYLLSEKSGFRIDKLNGELPNEE
jgi:tetratricopeptide (TPR) repeat protein